ncbi:MAG: hypothetical protein VX034_00115, partial [Planctomycetota bacterium]|nr:hypothetical protein [Planctomycetota bacterium]
IFPSGQILTCASLAEADAHALIAFPVPVERLLFCPYWVLSSDVISACRSWCRQNALNATPVKSVCDRA